MNIRIAWHAISLPDLFAQVKSSEEGLSQTEAAARLSQYGRNVLPEERGHSALHLLIMQFASPLMYIMMAATAVSFVLGNATEGFFILFVLMSNAIVGFYQEHKANQSLKMLKSVLKLEARVVRDSKEALIDASEIVPGDIIALRAGDKVPADGRILQVKDFRVSEATLTGESKPVQKTLAATAEGAEAGDRTNMVFMGTIVETGSATAIVTATGASTEYGDIVELLKETPEENTPLQKMVVSLSKFIGAFITAVVAFIALQGYLAGHEFHTIFEASLALFVSAIPEGLLPGITIVLVLGMRRILRERGLVRRLAATETLGGVTVICTDKTGTLTLGNMQASLILTGEGARVFDSPEPQQLSESARMSARIAISATDAFIENPGAPYDQLVIRGSMTEQALLRMSVRCGIDPYAVTQEEQVVDSLMFSSERKYAAWLRRASTGTVLYVLGAPEVVGERIGSYMMPNGEHKAEGHEYKALLAQKDGLVGKGYRVVACAYKSIGGNGAPDLEKAAHHLTLAGFIAITDPVREDVPAAFAKTKRAGIRTVIVTGDHYKTALAVAEKIGLSIHKDAVLEGHQIEAMSDKELREKSRTTLLYARVSPRHKLRIVQALQREGEVVAMLGDGINDAPALKSADIGVAVDTRVSAAREVADIVLLDGGFGTIIRAIEQGRIIFQNIRKVFLYLITQDFSQFFVFITAIFLGLPLPVIAAQLLLVNLVESGLPDLALTTEQEKEGIMDEPPRDPRESILNRVSRWWMLSVFLISGGIALLFYIVSLQYVDLATTRTMLMVFLSMESLFLVFSMRSFTRGIIRRDIFGNRILTWAVVLSFILVLSSIYMPALQNILATVPLTAGQWAAIIVANIFEILLIDRLKLHFFRSRVVPAQVA
ncbi:MAG TPA: cation-transporting P-type ATPase [Candidatus Paceibacterota bacterium]